MKLSMQELEELIQKASDGDQEAFGDLFSHYRKRLKKMIALRLHRQLQGRVDASDVMQEAFLESAKRLPDYVKDKPLPFFLWLRFITGQTLGIVHRRHLSAKMRDAAQEVSLHRGPLPAAGSAGANPIFSWFRERERFPRAL